MTRRDADKIAAAISEWGSGQEALTADAVAAMNRAGLGWLFRIARDTTGEPIREDGKIIIKLEAVAA